jgi:5-carboxymethyl-2-hydroxymuconate isomerase
MPHFTVEYSANLEGALSPQRLVETVHKAVLASGVFELAGLRTRAERRDIFMIADGDPQNAFIAVIGRVGPGRSAADRMRVAQGVMDALAAETKAVFESRGLALSVELAEIDNDAAVRKNNLHIRLKKNADGPKGAAA